MSRGEPSGERWKFSEFYGSGAAMGFTPTQIDKMSMWEFMSCVAGYNKTHGGKTKKGQSEAFSDGRLRDLGIEGF
ncbi:hypothetical protein PsAD2_04623 [Pseudovibrio axinellae]|uniref:Uncharacterized protein n=1 Tax=Pseudovibrio axinellae TaxID=989403 RepID=A0A165SVT9_9HYPH|nr:hypothetical protein [Pseudovibrio axinellae]KZL04540.1 hypothetical protein PsAD2_04623 [Pseudovibrio axinellae]SEQ73823.1 hypothetical protein SAMN05421798_10485 [Pseudovibrio axinellae]